MKRLFSVFIAVALTGTYGAVLPSGATPITFTGTSGPRAASVTFDTSGANLIVTLTNTSANDVLVPIDVLTGLFFTLAGDPTLTTVSALVPTGSTVLFPPAIPIVTNVGGEWAYVDGLSGAPGGADEGISSSGLDLFGSANFGGTNLQGPAAVNGLQYGITSAGDDSSTGNAPVTGKNALIKNAVVFTLAGLPTGFDPSATGVITNVSFQYGTALTEPNVPGDGGGGGGGGGGVIPEPGTFLLLGSGLVGLALYGRRKLGR